MLSPAQIRAARAMLSWSQNALAAKAGLHVNALRSIESGSSKARTRTDQRLRQAFEKSGVAFHGTGGVALHDELLQIDRIKSGDFITVFAKDILATLTAPRDELLTVTHDEMLFKKHDPSGIALYYQGRRRQKFSERCIVPIGGKHHSEKTHYRHLASGFIGPVSWVVYKDRVGLFHWDCNESIMIRNRQIAATYRATFEALWSIGRP